MKWKRTHSLFIISSGHLLQSLCKWDCGIVLVLKKFERKHTQKKFSSCFSNENGVERKAVFFSFSSIFRFVWFVLCDIPNRVNTFNGIRVWKTATFMGHCVILLAYKSLQQYTFIRLAMRRKAPVIFKNLRFKRRTKRVKKNRRKKTRKIVHSQHCFRCYEAY